MNQDRSTTITNSQLKEGYKQTELGIIPEDWEISQVKDIASHTKNAIASGPFGSDLVSNDYVDNGVPIIRGQNMRMQYLSGDFAFVTNEKARSLEANLARPRDIVFTQRGTLGQVSIVPNDSFEFYLVSQSQMKLTVNLRVADPLFFYYVFSSSEQQKYIQLNTIQTGVPHINLGILKKIPVQLPSIYEQEAIACTLSDIDALIESLDRLLTKKRQIKQGAMQELLRSKEEWETTNLGSLGSFTKGSGVRKDESLSGSLPCIRYGEIYTRHDDYIKHFYSWISLNVAETATRLKTGDLLFAGSGETKEAIGKCVAFINDIEAYAGGDIVILRLANSNAQFMGYYLNTSPIIRQKASKGQGDAVVHIGANALSSIQVTIPTLEEQNEIANILSDMDAEIGSIESKLAKTCKIKQGIMHELLTGRIRLVNLQI
jgi:type I restriction enzyme, S subunit